MLTFSQHLILISYTGMVGGLLVAQARGDKHLLVPMAAVNAFTLTALVIIAAVVR
jgi:hypothetical protein